MRVRWIGGLGLKLKPQAPQKRREPSQEAQELQELYRLQGLLESETGVWSRKLILQEVARQLAEVEARNWGRAS